ncbi:2-amino-4-hydroxy-6-hydroxymethyldihydropteridine diphosphokinase [Idiomarina fontislapidosi]|uniref:2-amino-4-hydroxy-6-hydroxymethyldihydropteridine diphosphokinase n=1 Tax=Idiomarina fontislapidosi TaxID=263723 RepID=A0A432XUU5_9GAMM|nr:2-amino-4-hydroxy-6-hydroxymethyldihydropteridine diphosphokinase [Idiomarina fontislapidosi]PYE31833.1 2-amino-4-hydroxy-6-hydroxymethyldihydropteridine diphosphokinase [Idiomarina fontislapidosi]RUO52492.1 2-amino-4-hydroxy-6-hydroxymethyldihydropteridine diphosphokinase [Idiomarina fontislapidosi]
MACVFLGIGSNLDRERHILNGLIDISEHFNWVRRSPVYESEAIGFAGHAFYNLVVEVTTELDVEAVLQQCKAIEQAHGRTHGGPKFSPRTLDIDVLLYDDLIRDADPQLPRAEILENAFVLQPLADIAPTRKHPVTGYTYHTLWQRYNRSQQLAPLADERWLPF